MREIKFKRDTAFRKQFFVPESFAHPAKMDAQLLIWIVEKYTSAGETILDPMAGSGTMMLACTLGRDVVLVELEEKFCKMMADNWNEVRMRPQLGCSMGDCQIIQGDARNLEGLLQNVGTCVFSPTYGNNPGTPSLGSVNKDDWGREGKDIVARRGLERGYSVNPDNIGNLPYGQIDKIVTSPPHGNRLSDDVNQDGDPQRMSYRQSLDSIITSPPYELSVSESRHGGEGSKLSRLKERMVEAGLKPTDLKLGDNWSYGASEGNIGNLKGRHILKPCYRFTSNATRY